MDMKRNFQMISNAIQTSLAWHGKSIFLPNLIMGGNKYLQHCGENFGPLLFAKLLQFAHIKWNASLRLWHLNANHSFVLSFSSSSHLEVDLLWPMSSPLLGKFTIGLCFPLPLWFSLKNVSHCPCFSSTLEFFIMSSQNTLLFEIFRFMKLESDFLKVW